MINKLNFFNKLTQKDQKPSFGLSGASVKNAVKEADNVTKKIIGDLPSNNKLSGLTGDVVEIKRPKYVKPDANEQKLVKATEDPEHCSNPNNYECISPGLPCYF